MLSKVFGMLIASVALAACSTTGDTQLAQQYIAESVAAPYQPVPMTPDMQAILDRHITLTLRDPGTVQLESVKAVRATLKTGVQSTVICGLMNGRNAYGAYTGFKPFSLEVVDGKSGMFEIAGRMTQAVCPIVGIDPEAF